MKNFAALNEQSPLRSCFLQRFNCLPGFWNKPCTTLLEMRQGLPPHGFIVTTEVRFRLAALRGIGINSLAKL